ncbi:hypothetical protein ACFQZE_11515 [Paenibacillus sp. GCM10027627]|uniref:hypothetical protein n=1 Tax=unclassified Paenibacillus TaxID=185978 RepID=UPI003644085E
MEPIYPLKQEVISNYCGLPVCAILKSGIRYVGVLKLCRNEHLYMTQNLYGGGWTNAHEPDSVEIQRQEEPPQNGAASKKGGKHKKASAASSKLSTRKSKPSPSKYAASTHNPSLEKEPVFNEPAIKLHLDEIQFLLPID